MEMPSTLNRLTIMLVLISLVSYSAYSSATELAQYNNNFDHSQLSSLPSGWNVSETLSGGWFSSARNSGKTAEWSIIQNSDSTKGNHLLALTKINNYSRNVFNIIHVKKLKFKNGLIKVKIRANSGEIDQGGGPVWRYQDNKNYYVARYNPLERNFRVYYVKNGTRIKLQSARNIDIKLHEWFEITISHSENHIQAWLNAEKLLDVKDSTHKTAGSVGLWTKADALTSFDDFSVVIK